MAALYCDFGCDTDVAEEMLYLSTFNSSTHNKKREEEAAEIANQPPDGTGHCCHLQITYSQANVTSL